MTNDQKMTEIIEANAVVEKLRATTFKNENLKNSALNYALLYIETLKRIDLNKINDVLEMCEIDDVLNELKNNYLIKVEELAL